jgi:hypothetical protein
VVVLLGHLGTVALLEDQLLLGQQQFVNIRSASQIWFSNSSSTAVS